MVWSWSHAPEAYAAVRDNIMALPRAEQEVILAEWKAGGRNGFFHPEGWPKACGTNSFDERRYQRALATLKSYPDHFFQDIGDGSIVGDRISRLAERQSTCENGGWEAWVCPYGCHTVPFHSPDEDDEEGESCLGGAP